MLRLARIHPLVRVAGLSARSNVHILRAYSSTNAQTPATEKEVNPLDLIAQAIAQVNKPKKEDKVPELKEEEEEEEEAYEHEEEEESVGMITQRVEDRFFPTHGTTAEAYDKLFEKIPAFEHKVDTEKLEKRQQFEQVYFANHVHEPKQVIKFKNLVTKNYRTVARSWPMTRLTSFKYGSEHFLDEMYDDIKGKYHWDNHLAYPDGSINLFCGTTSKASPLNVKEDPLALTYDDKQYMGNRKSPGISLTLSKAEAAARFPQLVAESEAALADEEPDAPLPTPAVPRPKPKLDETEAEQDEREAREEREDEEAFFKERADRRAARLSERAPKMWREEVPENETKEQREARWAREKSELDNRPWTDLMRQKRATLDERVLFDPVTMVKIVSYTGKGKMIERYYYRDQLTEDNILVHPANSLDALHLEPGFNPITGVVEALPDEDKLSLNPDSLPTIFDHDEVTYPNFPSTLEKNTKLAFEKILPLRDGQTQSSSSSSSYTASSTTSINEKTLPDKVKEAMTSGFKKLVDEGKLKPQDEAKYVSDFTRSLSIALARQKAEEVRLNKLNAPDAETQRFPGLVEIGPSYYFRYIKLNLAKGWIRFYVGEQDRSLGADYKVQMEQMLTFNSNTSMTRPFMWKYPPPTYSEYKLSPEDLEAMRAVKWPPSLVPPPTSPFQDGDGSPTHQLARYFENSYLRYGNLVRFRQDLTGSESLENTKAKYLRQVDPDSTTYTHVPDPGPIDFTKFNNPEVVPSEPAARAEFDRGLRETIRREAKFTIAEAKKEAYQSVVTHHDAFQNKFTQFETVTLGKHGYTPQLEEKLQQVDISTLSPQQPQVPLTQRFQQRGSSVVAFDASGTNVIQEYKGYRLKITRGLVRIIRVDQSAVIRFYNPQTGEKIREEDHSGDFFRPRSRIETDETSNVADKNKWEEATEVGNPWAYVERAHDQLVRVYNGEEAEEIEEEGEDIDNLLSTMKGFSGKASSETQKELDLIKDELLHDVLKTPQENKQ